MAISYAYGIVVAVDFTAPYSATTASPQTYAYGLVTETGSAQKFSATLPTVPPDPATFLHYGSKRPCC